MRISLKIMPDSDTRFSRIQKNSVKNLPGAISDGRASVFRALVGLEPSVFWISGFGQAQVGQDLLRASGQLGIYVLAGT